MIAGIFIRNFKAFEGLNFIPLTNIELDALQVSIGNNGVGKSSILEAIDVFFNERKWNPHKDSKHDDVYTAPVFLIKRKGVVKLLDEASNFFWGCDEKQLPGLKAQPAISQFFQFRNELKSKGIDNSHWLIVCGVKYTEQDQPFFGAFDLYLKKHMTSCNTPITNYFTSLIKSKYVFVYLPIEAGVQELLQLDNVALQTMAGKQLADEIDNILRRKSITMHDQGKGKDVSVVELITIWLDHFVSNINATAHAADPSYKYKLTGRIKNIKASDIRHDIIEAYFSKRILFKGDQSIEQLSSGEKRTALVDMACAFLSTKASSGKHYVLAIDEPESSMHTSICFSQFQKLSSLSQKLDRQVLITTHWYGLVPMWQKGALCHLSRDAKPVVKSFNMRNMLENRGDFPNDVEMKSYFDLVASMLTIMKYSDTNWIVCEGADDAKYLSHHLKHSIKNLNVIPVGGSPNVVKVYNYLYGPMSEKTEQCLLKGKILCIIDTDIQQADFDGNSFNKKNTIGLRRWQVYEEKCGAAIRIPKVGVANDHSKTTIEDCLNPLLFYKTIVDLFDKDFDITNNYDFDENCPYSLINQNKTILKPKTLTGYQKINELVSLINSSKYKISEEYTKSEKHSLPWCKEFIDFFS